MRLSLRNAVAAAFVCLVSISGITKIRTSSILNERLGVSPVSYATAIEGNHATTSSGAQQAGNEFPQVIQDYIKFHNETKFKPGAKYLIWRCRRDEQPCGGIGDRIKGIMSALYTAICTGRIILIDWPLQDGRDISVFLPMQRLDWRIQVSTKIPRYGAMNRYNNTWFKQLTVPNGMRQAPMIDMRANLWSGSLNQKASVRMNDTKCIQDFWKNEPPSSHNTLQENEYLFRVGFWTMFNFGTVVHTRKQEIQNHATLLQYASSNETREASRSPYYAGQTTVKPYVAVHIRTGIGSTWNDPIRHGSKEDYEMFYQCARRLQQGIYERQRQRQHKCHSASTTYDYQRQSPLFPIYVAADNNIAKEAMVELDQNTTSLTGRNTTVRVLEDMFIYHVDRSDQQGIDVESMVWGELNVLLESTCLVASRSGLSDLAIWLQPTEKRCAVMFNQCENETIVEQALDALDFSCANTWRN